jgi:hypothetical protein
MAGRAFEDAVTVTVIEPTDWEARLQAAVAETLRKRARRREERRQFGARRRAGLVARHRDKLLRQEAAQIEPANQEADT